MRIYRGSNFVKGKIKNPVLALGNFDGVHLAHQKMLGLTVKIAKKIKGTPCVYTFDPHPVKVLSHSCVPVLISTHEQKMGLFKKHKVHSVIIEPFSLAFAKLSPAEFFDQILRKKIKAAGVVAGYDFTFGAKREGNAQTLQALCKKQGMTCKILEPFFFENTRVSSSHIRELVRAANFEEVRRLLGRPFELIGTVIRGDKMGTQIGFPTANLLVENELLPSSGVYATRVKLGFKTFSSVTNIGVRPTFGGRKLTVETHLLGFKKNIYGKKIALRFFKKIRDEVSFSSPEELVCQIKKDIEEAKKILRSKKP